MLSALDIGSNSKFPHWNLPEHKHILVLHSITIVLIVKPIKPSMIEVCIENMSNAFLSIFFSVLSIDVVFELQIIVHYNQP